jgi:hypothetical protein
MQRDLEYAKPQNTGPTVYTMVRSVPDPEYIDQMEWHLWDQHRYQPALHIKTVCAGLNNDFGAGSLFVRLFI